MQTINLARWNNKNSWYVSSHPAIIFFPAFLLHSSQVNPNYFLHVWTHCTEIISWCWLHVWTGLFFLVVSRVHMWKRLMTWKRMERTRGTPPAHSLVRFWISAARIWCERVIGTPMRWSDKVWTLNAVILYINTHGMLLVQSKSLNTTNCCTVIHNTILRHVLYLILAFTHSAFSIHISTTLKGSVLLVFLRPCATHWHTSHLWVFFLPFSLSVLSQTQLLFSVVCYLFLRLNNKEKV